MTEFRDMYQELLDEETAMDKYEWIMNYGSENEPEVNITCDDATLVQGCNSPLWVEKVNGKVYCKSTALIVKGFAYMICDWWNQATDEQRNKFNLETLHEVGLAALISMGRQNGIANLIAKIKTL